MPFNINIPTTSGALNFDLEIGQSVFMLGANGTGKSSAMLAIYNAHRATARRISAHRQTWFNSGSVGLSAQEKRRTQNDMSRQDTTLESRWKDDYPLVRTTVTLYDLMNAENLRARRIAAAVDDEDIELAKTLSTLNAPLQILNDLLSLSNLPIVISVTENDEFLASKEGSVPYNVAELSDGERNALLIVASVLTASPGTLLLIDEPERHLHRSIISPLLSLLISKRQDCAFIVSTHELLLPMDNPSAQTLLIRGCNYQNRNVTSWDADLVPSESSINDDLKRDILGARRNLLFIEGDGQSLDFPLYKLVFPNVTILPKASCRDVEQAVSGLRGTAELTWLHAFGIVDSDRRPPQDVARLKENGIYALDVYSVESIYYHPTIQNFLAHRHATVTGENPEALVTAAKSAALEAISRHQQRLCERAVEKTLRFEIDMHWPKQSEISAGQPININIDVAQKVSDEITAFRQAMETQDLEKIIARYPVRETGALTEISRKLGFSGRTQYEGAVLKLLMDDSNSLTFVKSLFGTLSEDITNSR